jgi:CheY-like chemotaxis protein
MSGEPLRILIADDEPLFRLAVSDALRARVPGCVVIEVGDGMEAELALLGEPFACVVTDLQMPIVDGYGLLDVMRDRGIDVPIVVVSAHGSESTKQRVAQLGAARYFDKPVHLPALIDEVFALAMAPRSARSGDAVLAGLLLSVLELERTKSEPDALPHGWDEPSAAATPLPPLSLPQIARISSPSARSGQPAASAEGAPRSPSPSPSPSPSLASPPQLDLSSERNIPVNIEESLQAAMEISGCVGVTLVDFESGMSLGAKGTGSLNLDVAAAGNTEVIRAKMRTMAALGLDDKIEDVLITLSTQYHILRPLRRLPNLFLYLALDRSKANLALARMKASTIEQELRLLRPGANRGSPSRSLGPSPRLLQSTYTSHQVSSAPPRLSWKAPQIRVGPEASPGAFHSVPSLSAGCQPACASFKRRVSLSIVPSDA